jgi:hypothetical protein
VLTTAFSLNRHLEGCDVVYTCAKGCGETFTDKRAYNRHWRACTPYEYDDYEMGYPAAFD